VGSNKEHDLKIQKRINFAVSHLTKSSSTKLRHALSLLLSDAARPLRFVGIGGLAGLTQLLLLSLFTRLGWQEVLADVLAYILAAQANFVLSTFFTWYDRRAEMGSKKVMLNRWLTFHSSIIGTGLLNLLVFVIGRTVLPSLLASALGIACAAIANFFLFNSFVFRKSIASSGANHMINSKNTTVLQTQSVKEPVMMHGQQRATRAEVNPAPTVQTRPSRTPVYSIVAPVFNEKETLPHFYQRIVQVMEGIGESFELVFVNDGSSDGSYEVLQQLHESDARVHVIDFSRNFGHQIAISAGLDFAHGNAVIIMDSDLQDPPEVIPELVACWKNGGEVVYAQRTKREGETRFKLMTAAAFYRLISRITSINIPRDTGDFRLLDRCVVNTLIAMREQHRFMRGLSAWVGFRQEAVSYERHERFAGTTKYPLQKMIRFSMDAITSFSHVPLQLATSLGFILAGISLVGILVAVFLRLVTGAIVGQASTLILVLFLGGIQLIFLGIIGEYLGRIYDEVRARPLYIVREVLD
jgi:glycosyltransferase involved in cell wall biosynthesis/putative flippase GtrA